MWSGSGGIDFSNCCLSASGVAKEHENDDEGNRSKRDLNLIIVSELAWQLLILSAVEDHWVEECESSQHTYNASSDPSALP